MLKNTNSNFPTCSICLVNLIGEFSRSIWQLRGYACTHSSNTSCTPYYLYRKTHTLTCTRLKMYVTCGTHMSFLVHCVSVVQVVPVLVVFWYLYTTSTVSVVCLYCCQGTCAHMHKPYPISSTVFVRYIYPAYNFKQFSCLSLPRSAQASLMTTILNPCSNKPYALCCTHALVIKPHITTVSIPIERHR